jgi:hypothetical protein
MHLYADYPHLWTPPHYPSLFIVKVPSHSLSLDEKTYKDLMVQRVDWMIQHWLEDGNSLEKTQALLATTLSNLDSSQSYPLLNLEDPESFSNWAWRMEWAEAFIRHNYRFSESLWLMGMDKTGFPGEPLTTTHPEFESLMAVHQETDLETWLTELTPSSWE